MSDESANIYWTGKGKYQTELDKLNEAYLHSSAVYLTNNVKANSALKRLSCAGRKYYKYHNDGDYPGMGVPRWQRWNYRDKYSLDRVQTLETAMNIIVLRAWIATKHATLPSTHYINAVEVVCRGNSHRKRY
jgi:hypothetical protein